ncbi:DUF1453 domain-containing protein [Streptomyces sp. NPDC088766]|uniref:DUF1453 domain-containing protein n=1 Tax=Streptomyces sp. NPDC088766 TaxID=3365893 RepID=UPI0038279096
MPGLVNALLIAAVAAVAAVVIVRQFRAGRVDRHRRWWVLPGILAVVALREPDLLDARHHAASAAILAGELLVGLAVGAGWAWTTRIWLEADGLVRSRSTKASAAVWAVGTGLRTGLFACGVMVGIHQGGSALLLALATTLLVRSGILTWRVRSLEPASVLAPAYGDGASRSRWKERV